MPKKITTIYIDEALLDRITKEAERRNRSVSNLINLMLDKMFPEDAKRPNLRLKIKK